MTKPPKYGVAGPFERVAFKISMALLVGSVIYTEFLYPNDKKDVPASGPTNTPNPLNLKRIYEAEQKKAFYLGELKTLRRTVTATHNALLPQGLSEELCGALQELAPYPLQLQKYIIAALDTELKYGQLSDVGYKAQVNALDGDVKSIQSYMVTIFEGCTKKPNVANANSDNADLLTHTKDAPPSRYPYGP